MLSILLKQVKARRTISSGNMNTMQKPNRRNRRQTILTKKICPSLFLFLAENLAAAVTIIFMQALPRHVNASDNGRVAAGMLVTMTKKMKTTRKE